MYELISDIQREVSRSRQFGRCMTLTSTQGPNKGVALGNERPAGAEAEESNTLVARARAEQVTDKLVTPVIRKTDD